MPSFCFRLKVGVLTDVNFTNIVRDYKKQKFVPLIEFALFYRSFHGVSIFCHEILVKKQYVHKIATRAKCVF